MSYLYFKLFRLFHFILVKFYFLRVFFDCQEGRSREGPADILQYFKRYLQTNGYNVYDVFDQKENITLIHWVSE